MPHRDTSPAAPAAPDAISAGFISTSSKQRGKGFAVPQRKIRQLLGLAMADAAALTHVALGTS
jgi:hypothetical protein